MGHVVPFVACEILIAEIPFVLRQFFYIDEYDEKSQNETDKNSEENPELFLDLLGILKISRDEKINYVLAGYFEKVFQVLIAHHPKETFKTLYNDSRGQTALFEMLSHVAN
jgi:hypothetical protein